jgi:hypothetical protein
LSAKEPWGLFIGIEWENSLSSGKWSEANAAGISGMSLLNRLAEEIASWRKR